MVYGRLMMCFGLVKECVLEDGAWLYSSALRKILICVLWRHHLSSDWLEAFKPILALIDFVRAI